MQVEVAEGEGMPAEVAADPDVAEALRMRALLSSVDVEAMDSWDFDVAGLTHQQLVANLCQMFMQQGICQSRVSFPVKEHNSV